MSFVLVFFAVFVIIRNKNLRAAGEAIL